MKEYMLKPIMTPATVLTTPTPDKPVVAAVLPPRQPLPRPILDPSKPRLKLGLDVQLEFIMAVAQRDHASALAPRKFSREEIVTQVSQWVAEGLQVF